MEGTSGDEQSYIPQVGDDQKPTIGMRFDSIEDAFSFYNQYSRESGFSARISNSKKSKQTNEVIWKKFVCFKEGQTDDIRWSKQAKNDRPREERARGETRTGCKSRLSIVKEQTGPGWVVKANVPTCQQMRLFEIESGGPEHVGFLESDMRNYEKSVRDEHKGIDAETLIDFFESEKEKSSISFFDYETDSDNIFTRCFWADPMSRRAYNAFGDVIVFDTTYNTNKYGMIFAPFVGVNHHHQTIVFGCGFLSDEKTESFVWLLNKFLEAMCKGASNLIITDQDPAMTKAIAQVWPQTTHRYCLWHILNKFPEKLNPMIFRDHYQRIKNVIVYSSTSDEFESSWEYVMHCANLEQHEWLSLMDVNGLKKKWLEFQKEISQSHGYYVQPESVGTEFGVYKVMNFQGSSSSKPRVLTHAIQGDYISCSCMKFQFEGISCRHMLAFFRINQVFHLPDKYILKRWTQDAKNVALFPMDEQNVMDDPKRCLMSRHLRLSYKSSALVDVASLTVEGTNFLYAQFDYIGSKMKEMNIDTTLSGGSQSRRATDGTIGIIDPSDIRTKGCGKRLKSSKEKSTSKGRLCRGCGLRGALHDKRNCPNLQDGSNINIQNQDDSADDDDFGSIDGSNNWN
ncbi:protein FAR1-RELATED SEQUENCE 5-like [Primulina huaijiensis]|uniref:protein FAR1-RELATED SEQUENCE 5-like n=1 Tax=Primulina huaijiensis TaxID=1492673 RepID=UPI003CC79AE8